MDKQSENFRLFSYTLFTVWFFLRFRCFPICFMIIFISKPLNLSASFSIWAFWASIMRLISCSSAANLIAASLFLISCCLRWKCFFLCMLSFELIVGYTDSACIIMICNRPWRSTWYFIFSIFYVFC